MNYQNIFVIIILSIASFYAFRNFYLKITGKGKSACSGCSSAGSCSSFSKSKQTGATLGIKLEKFR